LGPTTNWPFVCVNFWIASIPPCIPTLPQFDFDFCRFSLKKGFGQPNIGIHFFIQNFFVITMFQLDGADNIGIIDIHKNRQNVIFHY
jgi:hypothetical protein